MNKDKIDDENKTESTMEDRKGYLQTFITRGYVVDSIKTDDGTEKHQVRFKGTLPRHKTKELQRLFKIEEISHVHNTDETHLLLQYNP